MVRFGLIGLLVIGNVFVWLSAFPERTLRVSFLNIGQGDSIFIEGPTGIQMLVDGGPNGSVLREFGKRMPFFDRTLDAVVETHPDKDHIGGLVDVFDRYDVDTFFEPGILNDTKISKALVGAVKTEGSRDILARRGMRILLGGGAYADILYPDEDVSRVKDTNTGSIVMRVVYGNTSFLLTGDSPQAVERHLIALDPEGRWLESDVLKPGHHGSRTSTAPEYVAAVKPSFAVISAGKDNSYGHPHQETLQTLAKAGVRVLSTIDSGTITFSSDGFALEKR
jgi:competence protein ComEC